MAASGAPARPPRRGPAPIASFDHDGSDEASPESRAPPPEVREAAGPRLPVPGEGRARSHSTPAAGALAAPAAPRIDISRASSSSHHDSRDSSPELALLAGGGASLDAGFREDGALDLRSSTEELAFLEPAPGEPPRPAPAPTPAPAPPAPPAERRHSRKDSQSSEAALLGVSGRTSRLSSVGSQCSAVSRVSRLSVVSGASRSPSPHRMLLETSFCGPKPIETDPEIGAGALVEQILGLVRDEAAAPAPAPPSPDARDHREVRTEVTVESARPAPAATAAPPRDAAESASDAGGERRARPRLRREPSEPEVYKPRNRAKDVIIIKLRPDDSREEDEPEPAAEAARKPDTLELSAPSPPRARSPSPARPAVSRKSSFCSLFKSRETIASPESPSEALRRKRSLTEGRSRSKSRERSQTPTSAAKIRGSVLSLFRTPKRGAASPSPSSREGSPAARPPAPVAAPPPDLKYYEAAKDGIVHIPLRSPPDERRGSGGAPAPAEPRPASAPQARAAPVPVAPTRARPLAKPVHRTVLPDGSIIIPLHSPTERVTEPEFPEISPDREPSPARASAVPDRPAEPAVSPPAASPPGQAPSPPGPAPSPPGPAPGPPVAGAGPAEPEEARRRRKERLVFTTHVGSREQVFSTQFSITKTPSVASEISGSLPSFEGEPPAARDERGPGPAPGAASPPPDVATPPSGAGTPADAARDSSESEPSSEAAPSRVGVAANEVEKRVLVVQQESFEEELPYVPTTLPQERSVAVPMVPVRERGDVRVSGVRRPRGAPPPARAPAPPPTPPAPPPARPADKLRIKLPRRARPASASAAPPAPPAPAEPRARSRSGGDTEGGGGGKAEWIDFSEVPERRKQPKRIQTLPGAAPAVLLAYVPPEHCRCECHATPPPAPSPPHS